MQLFSIKPCENYGCLSTKEFAEKFVATLKAADDKQDKLLTLDEWPITGPELRCESPSGTYCTGTLTAWMDRMDKLESESLTPTPSSQ